MRSHSPTHSMVPLTVNPSGQLEKHRPLCEYRPSLHFVQKFRLKHASQFSILHSEIKKDQKKKLYHYFIKSCFKLWTSGPPPGDLLLWLLQFLIQKVSFQECQDSQMASSHLCLITIFDQTYKLPQIGSNCGLGRMKTRNRIHFPTPLLLSSLSYFDKQGIQFLNVNLNLFLWRCKT